MRRAAGILFWLGGEGNMSCTIRPLRDEDRSAVREIFNHYVVHGTAAYTEDPVSGEFTERMTAAALDGGAWVAEKEATVVGFALLRPYSSHSTFSHTAVVTYFIAPQSTRSGIGSLLLARLVEGARSHGVETILAHISSDNAPSLAFHRRHGFVECGRFRSIGRKRGRTFDVVWMQRMLDVKPPQGDLP